MTGRFNQDLPENLQTAFEKAMNHHETEYKQQEDSRGQPHQHHTWGR